MKQTGLQMEGISWYSKETQTPALWATGQNNARLGTLASALGSSLVQHILFQYHGVWLQVSSRAIFRQLINTTAPPPLLLIM